MIAILSDVHSNLEALTAVFKDLRQRDIQRIFFLGDIVGYGPDPVAVLDFIRNFEFCLLGNHDQACLEGPPRTFNVPARRAAEWTRQQVRPEALRAAILRPAEYQKRKEQWEYLQNLKPVRLIHDVMFVHDTPAAPGSCRYVLTRAEADAGFAANPTVRAFFFGHSHRPLVWTPERYFEAEPGKKFDFKQRVMVNVGSVGQPRDGDPRASYVILEPDGFRFYRVPYDVAKTQEKMLACPELDPTLAHRLAKGR